MNHNSLMSAPANVLRLLLAAALMAMLATAALPAPIAHAAQFTVDTTDDTIDVTPGDGLCADASGDCSLRAAIMEANALPGLDTITLPAGIYNLIITGDDDFGPSTAIGDLDVLDDLNITGDGAGVTIIDGGKLTRSIDEYDRVFDIAPESYLGGPVPDITVNLSGITIRNGKTRNVGGAIRYASALTVVDSVIRDNEAAMGGGLARAGFILGDPRLTLENVTVSGNRALSEHGGGIFALGSTSLTIQDSIIVNNRATNSGAGIHAVAVVNSPTLTNVQVLSNMTTGTGTGSRGPGGGIRGECLIITDSTISSNSANQGGGIFIGERPCLTVITNSHIGGNGAERNGGGILNFGNLSQPGGAVRIIGSTIRSNEAGEDGGGIANGQNGTMEVISTTVSTNDALGEGGGIFNDALGELTVQSSAISSNESRASNSRGGGGIAAHWPFTVTHTTISGNRATTWGGGIYYAARGIARIDTSTLYGNSANHGGAIKLEGTEETIVILRNATITGNSAASTGGGIAASFRNAMRLQNTILALNTAPIGPNCDSDLLTQGHNLFGDMSGCSGILRDPGSGPDIVCPDFDRVPDPKIVCPTGFPGLGAFTDEGTPGRGYIPLLPDSPAIDAGEDNACPPTDQRGIPRPLGRHCDIGAFEAYPFPQDRVLDDFTRPGGSRRLGPAWSGSVGGYIVLNPEVDVEAGGPIYWKADLFGARQEAFVTLTRVDPAGFHQSLLLKVQDNARGLPDWRRGAIAVFYRAAEGLVGIETFVPGRGWHTLATFPMTLRDGDQLGARALADGMVEAYVNGRFIGQANAGSFFVGKGGRIGLWFIVAADAMLDDFGGGTMAP